MKKSVYSPPYQITPEIVRLISEISETLGGFSAANPPVGRYNSNTVLFQI